MLRPVYFLHPHRGGGTTICQLSKLAGERTPLPDKNCNFNFGYDWNFPRMSVVGAIDKSWTCGRLTSTVKSRGLTFLAPESYLVPVPLCATFSYIIVLRQPLDRLAADLCIFDTFRKDRRAPLRAALSNQTTDGFWHGSRWSNYYVRILLGREVFRQRSLPPHALALANRTMQSFSAVLVIERLDAQLPHLQRALGWTDKAMRRWRLNSARNKLTPASCRPSNWTTQLIDDYKSVNRLDMALYESWTHNLDRTLVSY